MVRKSILRRCLNRMITDLRKLLVYIYIILLSSLSSKRGKRIKVRMSIGLYVVCSNIRNIWYVPYKVQKIRGYVDKSTNDFKIKCLR